MLILRDVIKKKEKINRNEVNKFIYLIINIIKRLSKKYI